MVPGIQYISIFTFPSLIAISRQKRQEQDLGISFTTLAQGRIWRNSVSLSKCLRVRVSCIISGISGQWREWLMGHNMVIPGLLTSCPLLFVTNMLIVGFTIFTPGLNHLVCSCNVWLKKYIYLCVGAKHVLM